MSELGRSWEHGRLGIVHEHMASAVIRTVLGSIASGRPRHNGAPVIIVATPAGAYHELGALMGVVTAVSTGWNPTYPGPSLPAGEIASAARARGARAVALSVTFPPADPAVADELERLRGGIPDTPIVVGGEAAASYAATLDSIHAMHHATMHELRETLDRLAREDHSG